MAFEIGVASDHVDLWDKLLAFLTTNPDLVATGQNWSIGWQVPIPPGVKGVASSSSRDGTYSPSAFFYKDLSNKWLSGSSGCWVEFEFVSAVSVNHVIMRGQTGQTDGRPINVSIQHYDGSSWVTDWTTDTGLVGTNGQVVQLTDPDYLPTNRNPEAKRWRVLVNSNSGNANTCIAQLDFYDDPAGASLIQQPHTLNETDCVVVGPGTGGTDQIYVGLRRVDNPATDHYTLWMNGMTGLLTGATQITEHVNTSDRVAVYLDSAPMNYWFVANGRRFMAVIKIATIYEALYGGLFLPYADPLQYSYPLFIGGSVKRTRGEDLNINWGDTDTSHRNYTLSTGSPYASQSYDRPATAYMLSPSAEWKHVSYSAGAGSAFLRPFYPAGGLETNTSASNGTGLTSMLDKMRECLGGGFSLDPATLVSNDPVDQTYGTLEGVYHTPSETNYSENLITIGGADHLVFQNIWRTDERHLAAMALE